MLDQLRAPFEERHPRSTTPSPAPAATRALLPLWQVAVTGLVIFMATLYTLQLIWTAPYESGLVTGIARFHWSAHAPFVIAKAAAPFALYKLATAILRQILDASGPAR